MRVTGVKLRDVGPFDGSVIAALHVLSFGEAGWTRDAVADILAMPGAFGHLLVVHDRPAGFVLARAAADECEILSLGVGPMDRRRGFGRRLLRAAIAHAEALAAGVVHIEAAEDNIPAIALYRAEGFLSTGRRPAYYKRPGNVAVEGLILSRQLV